MIITDKMIRELQRRVDVSYEDAERYVRRAGGNIDMAEAYARKKQNSFSHRFFRGIENLISTTFVYRLKVYRSDDVFMDMPIFLFFILLFIIGVDKTITIGVIFIIIALVAECQLKLHKVETQEAFRFYRTVNKEKKNKEHNKAKDTQAKDFDTTQPIQLEDGQLDATQEKSTDKEVKNQQPNDEGEDYYEVTIDK
ncbi:hypothetical protein QBE53_09575 [Vallitaleaceae bacterium 9-2]